MTKTLLDGVNQIFTRTKVIAGDAAFLTTLTDSARQHPIDLAVQVINEGVDKLYLASHLTMPMGQGQSTLVLVDGTRDYTLASDLVILDFPLIDRTNSQYIAQFPGGYEAMLILDLEQDDTGLPHYAAINPTNSLLHMDRAPTSVDAGRIYTYQYKKDVSLAVAADTFTFTDTVFRAMVPVWVQLYKRDTRQEFDAALYQEELGVASRALTQIKPRTSYLPR